MKNILISIFSLWSLIVGAAVASPTIIDILSSSAQYSTLLYHIRRNGLVPLINTSRNATLAAPINSAFASVDPQDVTRDLLLYHLLSIPIVSSEMKHGDLIVDSFLTASAGSSDDNKDNSDDEGRLYQGKVPVLVNKPKGDDRNDLFINQIRVVEKDIKAGTYRGVVQAIDKLLTIPNTTCGTLAAGNLEVEHFARFMHKEHKCRNSSEGDQSLKHTSTTTRKSTWLVPGDSAFQRFNEVELSYLNLEQQPLAHDDRQRILNRHTIPGEAISSESDGTSNNKTRAATSQDGNVFQIASGSVINRTFEPIATNILTQDGIIHIYGSLLSSPGSDLITFTPEKYLYGLDAEYFVKELLYRGLHHLIDGTKDSFPQTIFVPVSALGPENQMVGQSALSLLYHFMDKQYHMSEHVNEEFLMTSQMVSQKLKNHAQRVKVITTASGSVYLNGHPVVSKEYEVGNTSIYFVDGDLDVPPSLSLALGPFFQNSYSLVFLKQLGLLYPPAGESWTVFLPTSEAWQEQGLLKKYLAGNTTALRMVFESLIFDRPFYTDSQSANITGLDGRIKTLSTVRHDNSSSSTSVIKIADIERDSACSKLELELNAPDILFDAGVVHSVDNLVLPPTVDITAADLITAGGRQDFIDLLEARNMSHLLAPGSGYTILVPNMQSLANHNVTADSDDIDLLLSMHVLPGNPIDDLFSETQVDTLADGVALKARDILEGLYFIQIVGGADHELHILTRGDTNIGLGSTNNNTTTILFIDRYLKPEWISTPFLSPPYHMKTVIAILIGVVGGAILIFCIISAALYLYLWQKQQPRKGTERDPLLGGGGNNTSNGDGGDEIYGAVAGYDAVSTGPSRSRNHSRHNSGQSYHSTQSPTTTSPPTNENYNSNYTTRLAPRAARGSQLGANPAGTAAPIRTAKVHPDREFGRHLNLPQSVR